MMNFTTKLLICSGIVFLMSCESNNKMTPPENLIPPIADKIEYQHKIHDDIRIDPFFWLRERDNPEVIDYLERENDYYDKMTAHTQPC